MKYNAYSIKSIFLIRLDIDYLSRKPISLPVHWSRIRNSNNSDLTIFTDSQTNDLLQSYYEREHMWPHLWPKALDAEIFKTLTVGEGENADDQEEGDDQDETHPQVIVMVSIISATETCGHALKKPAYTQPIFLFLLHHSFTILCSYTHQKMQSDSIREEILVITQQNKTFWNINVFPIDDAAERVWN